MAKSTLEVSELVKQFVKSPKNSKHKSQLNSFYWHHLESLIKSKSMGGEAGQISLSEKETLFTDLGFFHKDLMGPDNPDTERLKTLPFQRDLPQGCFFFSQWLNKQYDLILRRDLRETLNKEIKNLKKEITALNKSTSSLQKQREENFAQAFRDSLNAKGTFSQTAFNRGVAKIARAREADKVYRSFQDTKLKVEHGAFLDKVAKRAYIDLQIEIKDIHKTVDNAISEITNIKSADAIRKLGQKIELEILQDLKMQRGIGNIEKELNKITEEVNSLSAVEIENALGEIITYNRELVKLSARRNRAEPMSVLHSGQKVISLTDIEKIMETATEFDPGLFKNTRVKIHGKPAIVLVPGYGDGVYDWKYNALVIPTMPYRDPRVSVFTAVVEYKLDCDEDKVLLHSFSKLKDYSGIRSIFSLKAKFIKDYVTFMNQETKGYKVLPKHIRQWFEQEIVPSKNKIKVPIKYDPVLMTSEEFKSLKTETTAKIESQESSSEDYFIMGIIQENMTEDANAMNSFIQSVIADKNNLNAIFNAGIMALKMKERKAAIKFFTRYIQLEPQSWWSSVCHDHISKLR